MSWSSKMDNSGQPFRLTIGSLPKSQPKPTDDPIQKLLRQSRELLDQGSSLFPKTRPRSQVSQRNSTAPTTDRFRKGLDGEGYTFFGAQYHDPSELDQSIYSNHDPQTIAVHHYYVRPEEDYELVWSLHRPTVNSVVVIHNHSYDKHCEGGPSKNQCQRKVQ